MLPFLTVLLRVTGIACAACLAGMMIYQLVLSLFGFGRKVKDYQDHDPQSRFLVLVPAHNEEKVIGDIVRNLQTMDYPRELYDIYVVPNNCTDDTEAAAVAAGAKILHCTGEIHSKGDVLRQAFAQPFEGGLPLKLVLSDDQIGRKQRYVLLYRHASIVAVCGDGASFRSQFA